MGLQVWLPLNGNLDNKGMTSATIVNNGAVINNNGKIGKCYSFDGSDDYISIDCPDLYSIIAGGSQSFTMAFWAYHSDSTRGVLFGDYGLTGHINFNVEFTTNGRIRFYWAGSPDRYISNETASSMWTHFTIRYDGLNLSLYRNGTVEYSSDITLAQKTKTSGVYYLGRDSRTGATALNGMLNDFRIYDHALSPNEIKHIAQALMVHYSLSNRGFGGDNLLRNSLNIGMSGSDGKYKTIRTFNSQTHIGKVEVSDTEHSQNSWRFVGTELGGSSVVQELTTGENTYTFSCDVKVTNYTNGKVRVGFDFRTSSVSASTFYTLEANEYDGNWHRVSMQITTNNSQNTQALWVINTAGTVHGSLTVIEYKNPKLERGSRATPWMPNSADALYSSLGLNSTAELDCSGYQYNGIKNNVTNDTDSPVNKGCYVFNGTNSWVKCNTNEWMVQGATELTINEWAYADDWTKQTNAHLFSCTQSGGFNTESAGNGYLRFPRHVYSNEAKSSSGYQMSNTAINLADLTPGWHMFTFIYNTTGDKIYIDGEFYNSYNVVSYGLHFNTGARLYLGCESNGANPNSPYFNGKLSDFRLYYTELDEDAIKELYRMGEINI